MTDPGPRTPAEAAKPPEGVEECHFDADDLAAADRVLDRLDLQRHPVAGNRVVSDAQKKSTATCELR